MSAKGSRWQSSRKGYKVAIRMNEKINRDLESSLLFLGHP